MHVLIRCIFCAATTASLFTIIAVARDAAGAAGMPKGETLAKSSDCVSCHAMNQKIVGPSYTAIANKFAGQADAGKILTGAIRNGHVGTWGDVAMPPHPQINQKMAQEIVAWILSLKNGKPTAAASDTESGKTYTYKEGGKAFTTDFAIFQPGTKKVTKSVFKGYELYNSYCFRCHGGDATGSAYAPDLRQSLNNGMTRSQFLSVAMEGRKAKGMPSWAGFFTPDQIDSIYEYVKARSIGAVDVGTPVE